MTKYTLFIDETGDAGIDKVRKGVDGKGASPILVIAGCLIPDNRAVELKSVLQEIRSATSKANLHCTEMGHFAVAKYARMVSEKAGILCFAFVSTKSTMGSYKDQISGKGQDQKYYNKCVSYFLERVGHFMRLNSISGEDLKIVFEERRAHDYAKLKNYLRTIKRNPHDKRLGFYLGPILPDCIESKAKPDEELLCYPDLVAFSVAAAINASAANLGVPEQRYLRELKNRFFKEAETGVIGEFGLKLFKRYELDLDRSTSDFFEKWHSSEVEPNLHDGGKY
ncbi:DUF3800 domain-containing protein [Sulfitobacter sp.]|uniref:DUF3800 domain-containing protein n=1 Tax=Sulfitobacter sp. TaxID=1903071 RepID=UPI0032982701